MNMRNALLVVAGGMFAWVGVASAELTMSWTGERQGVARAAVDGDTDSAEEPVAAKADTDDPEGTSEESQSVSREEYLAAVAWVEGEAAVDELSRRMVDGLLGPERDGEGSEYGESTLPGGTVDRVPDAVQMTRGGTVGTRTAGGSFSASDDSGNYSVGQNWVGENGGSGFGEWRPKDGSADLAVSKISGTGGFIMQAGADPGETAMMRSLDTEVGLASGEFSVTVWGAGGGADERGDFAGFAVYGSNDSELFRWGFYSKVIDDGEELIGISSYWYSSDGGLTYEMVPGIDGYPLPEVGVEYSLTWAQLGGTMHFTLSATEKRDGLPDHVKFSGHEVDVETSEYVMAIAAVLTEGGLYSQGGDGSEMTFDNLSVTGTEPTPAVPEPGTLGLLAAGLAALWRRKAKREK